MLSDVKDLSGCGSLAEWSNGKSFLLFSNWLCLGPDKTIVQVNCILCFCLRMFFSNKTSQDNSLITKTVNYNSRVIHSVTHSLFVQYKQETKNE